MWGKQRGVKTQSIVTRPSCPDAHAHVPQSINCQPEAAWTRPLLDGMSASPNRTTCCAVHSTALIAGLAMLAGSSTAATAARRLADFMTFGLLWNTGFVQCWSSLVKVTDLLIACDDTMLIGVPESRWGNS